jgi:hypothetical protein
LPCYVSSPNSIFITLRAVIMYICVPQQKGRPMFADYGATIKY